MRKGINHFLKELGILLFFAFPWFYANILGYYYPVLMHRYAVIIFFIITFSILLCLYISFWVDFYIILVNSIDPNYMKLSPKYPSFIQKWYEEQKEASKFTSEAWILRARLSLLFFTSLLMIGFLFTTLFIYSMLFILRITLPFVSPFKFIAYYCIT